jgi:hypothetical protein
MTTGSITQAGIESNLIHQKMNELNQEPRTRTEKGKEESNQPTDTVNLTVKSSEKPNLEFEPIDEKQADILAQLVANDLSKQSYGMSTQTGIDALRSFL